MKSLRKFLSLLALSPVLTQCSLDRDAPKRGSASNLSTVNVGAPKAREGQNVKPWETMTVKLDRFKPDTASIQKSYAIGQFASGTLQDQTVVVPFGSYKFLLTLSNNKGDLVYESCAADKEKEHEIKKAKYNAEIALCEPGTTTPIVIVRPTDPAISDVIVTPTLDDGGTTGEPSTGGTPGGGSVEQPTGERPRPFPQALTYKQGLMPAIPAAERNEMVAAVYKQWKQKYLKYSDALGGYYVTAVGTNTKDGFITHSEAHGWGMLITAIMAGHDPEAKKIFDGMYRIFDAYRAQSHDGLMIWQVLIPKTQESTATDGDLDIAYALLLAHYQWGSSGPINYLAQAKRSIAGIREKEVNKDHWIVPGEWALNRVPEISRSSDFMTSHFRAFGKADQAEFWQAVLNKSHGTARRMVDVFRAQELLAYGLMPDFIESFRNSEGSLMPRRPAGQVLEKPDDRNFNWNANRYPWRITMDYLLHGDKDSQFLGQMASDFFLRAITENSFNANNIDFTRFKAGYSMEGQALVSYSSAAFTAPALVAVMAQDRPERSALSRKVLTEGYRYLATMDGDYYGDSIRLLCMLALSGNYWSPVN